jgi:2-iminobutanoate/2-iminopropanoate deaminase
LIQTFRTDSYSTVALDIRMPQERHWAPQLHPRLRRATIEAMLYAKQRIATDAAPAAIGPYAQAVRVGTMVYTSGQVALEPGSGALTPGGIREQTERVFQNLTAVLGAAGCDLADVVKTTVYLKDMNDFAAMNEVYAQYLAPEGVVPPARSTVQVARLPKDALVEIEAIALARAAQ